MNVPLLDLQRVSARIRDDLFREWSDVLNGMKLLGGENLLSFEKEIAEYMGSRYAYGVGSGSDALILGLVSCGIGQGDEVILHANAFAADLEAIKWIGAKPVLVDMKEDDFGPVPEQIREKITGRTKALIVVHMYGHPVTMGPIIEIKERWGLKLIEDCSHAHGAEYRGRKVGTFGDVGCFSCGVVKNLGAFGDAGFCTTDAAEIAERLNLLRVHGQRKKNQHVMYGFNSRLDELQAVVLRIRLRSLDQENGLRREIARQYGRALSFIEGVVLPPDHKDRKSVYHRYVIRTDKRDELMAFLKQEGIEAGVQYPQPLHKQDAWMGGEFGNYDLPVSERVCSQILSIPMYPEINNEEIEYVIDKVKGFFENQ